MNDVLGWIQILQERCYFGGCPALWKSNVSHWCSVRCKKIKRPNGFRAIAAHWPDSINVKNRPACDAASRQNSLTTCFIWHWKLPQHVEGLTAADLSARGDGSIVHLRVASELLARLLLDGRLQSVCVAVLNWTLSHFSRLEDTSDRGNVEQGEARNGRWRKTISDRSAGDSAADERDHGRGNDFGDYNNSAASHTLLIMSRREPETWS